MRTLTDKELEQVSGGFGPFGSSFQAYLDAVRSRGGNVNSSSASIVNDNGNIRIFTTGNGVAGASGNGVFVSSSSSSWG